MMFSNILHVLAVFHYCCIMLASCHRYEGEFVENVLSNQNRSARIFYDSSEFYQTIAPAPSDEKSAQTARKKRQLTRNYRQNSPRTQTLDNFELSKPVDYPEELILLSLLGPPAKKPEEDADATSRRVQVPVGEGPVLPVTSVPALGVTRSLSFSTPALRFSFTTPITTQSPPRLLTQKSSFRPSTTRNLSFFSTIARGLRPTAGVRPSQGRVPQAGFVTPSARPRLDEKLPTESQRPQTSPTLSALVPPDLEEGGAPHGARAGFARPGAGYGYRRPSSPLPDQTPQSCLCGCDPNPLVDDGCEVEKEDVAPWKANSKYIVQLPDAGLTQSFTVTKCSGAAKCQYGGGKCSQIYCWKPLLTWDRATGNVSTDYFRYPACCNCDTVDWTSVLAAFKKKKK